MQERALDLVKLTSAAQAPGRQSLSGSLLENAKRQQLSSSWSLESLVQCEAEFRMRLTCWAEVGSRCNAKVDSFCWEQPWAGLAHCHWPRETSVNLPLGHLACLNFIFFHLEASFDSYL